MMSTIQPYIYGEQDGYKIDSSIASMIMHNCTEVAPPEGPPSKRRKRRSVATLQGAPLTPKVPFVLSLKPKDIPTAEWVNATPVDVNKMIFHTVNLSTPLLPVQINIYPKTEQILSVYISTPDMPSLSNFTWNYTLPRNISQVDQLSEADFTIFLQTDALEMALNQSTITANTSLFIGVRHYGKP